MTIFHVPQIPSLPARAAARRGLAVPALRRDDGFVHRSTAELLERPPVRACFGLEALPDAALACEGAAATVVSIASAPPRGSFSC